MKQYFLSNHLGNTLAIISDKRFAGTTKNGVITSYVPDIVSATDYSSFGVSLLGRQINASNVEYGFDGKWNEVETGYQNYGMRDYDARARRFASVDPLTKKYPWYTPYQFAGNKPIKYIDEDGLEEADPELDREDREELERESEIRNLKPPTDEELKNRRESAEEWERMSPKRRVEWNTRTFNYIRNGLDAAKEIFDPSNPVIKQIKWNQLFPPVTDPYTKEKAEQSPLSEALKVRAYVQRGGPVFRLGTEGTSKQGADAQFWSTIDPRVDPVGFAKSLNIPQKNVQNADFVEQAQVNTFAEFITRPAEEDKTLGAANTGKGIEVLVPYGGTRNNKITSLKKQ